MYVARDKNGSLFLYSKLPKKSPNGFIEDGWDCDCDIIKVPTSWFKEVKWSDKKPRKVSLTLEVI